jgi:hypothetical protein
MAYINDSAFDAGLAYISTNGTRLDLCSAEPTSYALSQSLSLANKASGLSFGAPTDRTPNGRKIVLGATTGGTATANGTATHWALTNGSNLLVATGALSPTLTIVSGASVSTSTLDIGIADATAG